MSDLEFFTITDPDKGYTRTFSGKNINLRNPTPLNIDIKDIAAGLSKICRFGGQCSEFYSVAQHSVLVAQMVPDHCKGTALLHDAAEAYLGDVVKPLKILLGPVYADLETSFEQAIHEKYLGLHGLYGHWKSEIKKCDILALRIEDEAFRRGKPERLRYFFEKYDMLMSNTQLGWPPYMAELLFTKYFKKLI